ncbi:hypothetical protein Avbf_14219 [Armadillidium vulgare]|nr:hypothetical protein Avbf_14219 [Armadillidium vulgare]
MHQGMYTPSPEYNILIDGLIKNVQQDLKKREMDPLYFGIHNRGIVSNKIVYMLHSSIRSNRHSTQGQEPLQEHLLAVSSQANTDGNDNSSLPLGVGIIKGLLKLKRFGNAESRKDGDVTLVRSHYFFGPLDIDLLFGSVRGIHILNTTLSSLAAHALLQVSDVNNSTILKEFITDR